MTLLLTGTMVGGAAAVGLMGSRLAELLGISAIASTILGWWGSFAASGKFRGSRSGFPAVRRVQARRFNRHLVLLVGLIGFSTSTRVFPGALPRWRPLVGDERLGETAQPESLSEKEFLEAAGGSEA